MVSHDPYQPSLADPFAMPVAPHQASEVFLHAGMITEIGQWRPVPLPDHLRMAGPAPSFLNQLSDEAGGLVLDQGGGSINDQGSAF